jgi:hypothetical protein
VVRLMIDLDRLDQLRAAFFDDGSDESLMRLYEALFGESADLIRLARIGQAQRGDLRERIAKALRFLDVETPHWINQDTDPAAETIDEAYLFLADAILAAPSMAVPDPLGASWQAAEDALPKLLLKVVDEHIAFCGGDDWPNHMSISESHFIRTLRSALAAALAGVER